MELVGEATWLNLTKDAVRLGWECEEAMAGGATLLNLTEQVGASKGLVVVEAALLSSTRQTSDSKQELGRE